MKRGLVIILLLIGSFAKADDQKVKLTFEIPVEVSFPSKEGMGTPTLVPSGQSVELEREKFAWIQAKGKVPVLVVPTLPKDADEAKMSLPDVANWPSEQTLDEIDRKVSLMIEDIARFQTAIRKRDLKEAETILTRLEATQNIGYLAFLRASLDFVKGDLKSARMHVKRGLQRHPANEQGLNLLKTLGEEKP